MTAQPCDGYDFAATLSHSPRFHSLAVSIISATLVTGYRTQVQDYPCDGYIAPRTATIEVRLSNIDLSTSASYSLANSDAIRALQATVGKRSSDVAL